MMASNFHQRHQWMATLFGLVTVICVAFALFIPPPARAQSTPDWEFLNTMGLPWRCGEEEEREITQDWNDHWAADPPSTGVAIDFNASDDYDKDVLAPFAGEVSIDYWPNTYGLSVIIRADNGWMVRLAHLLSNSVEDGNIVEKGDVVGRSGDSGNSQGVHIHLELTWNDSVPDPNWFNTSGNFLFSYPTEAFLSSSNTDFYSNNCGRGPETTLFWNQDFTGYPYNMFGAGTFNIPAWFNDQASSLRLDSNWGATVFEHTVGSNWPGAKRSYWISENDFSDDYFEPPHDNLGVNDKVSSIQIFGGMCYPSPNFQEGYRYPNDPCPTGDDAAFISDITIPDGTIVSPNQSLEKTWQMRNTGSSIWGNGYELVFTRGNRMNGSASVPVPTTSPGAEVDISVTLTAPNADGNHRGYWQLRNPQGTFFGPEIWVDIEVVSSNPGGNITLFDISPPSPSESEQIHLVGRIHGFPEFRSMRFVVGGSAYEGIGFQQIGDQLEISMDWQTASLPRGDYAILFEVTSHGDPGWTNPERQVQTYTLSGTPAPVGRPPERPILQSPYNWFLEDAAGSSAPVEMCVHPTSDPDGDSVTYLFELNGGSQSSGWISSTCWEPTLAPGAYTWRVKASDGTNESDWSSETWNFNVAFGGVTIDYIDFYEEQTDNTHICVGITFGGIIAPEVRAFINGATDGSENGTWFQLDGYGPSAPPDCTGLNEWGFWIRSTQYESGNHVVRVTAVKNDSGEDDTRTATYNIAYIRPPAPVIVAPATYDDNGTWWNEYDIDFWWNLALRTESQQLRVSLQQDIWNDPAPLVEVDLGSTTISYTHTFTQDYDLLYWGVRAINSAGTAESSSDVWFGIDVVDPTCTIAVLPPTTPDSVFQVSWLGADNAAGVRTYDIQHLDSGRNEWSDWLTSVPVAKTFDLFTGLPGHSYGFRCRATDQAGNTGAYPGTADTSTLVDPTTLPTAPWWDTNYNQKRNLTIQNDMPATTLPANYPVHIHFDSGTTPTASELYDASLSSPKCDDLRVAHEDTTEVDRVVQKCTSSEIDIWFRTQVSIPGSGADGTSHQLYYGNAAAGTPPGSPNTVFDPPDDANVVGLWYMNEGSGTTLTDNSGNGNNCSIDATTNWIGTDKFIGALHFQGGTDGSTVNCGSSSAFNLQAFTYEMFVRRTGTAWGRLAGHLGSGQNRWLMSYNGNGTVKVSIWPCSTCGSEEFNSNASIPNDSNWHHVAFTLQSSTVKIYIDGQLDSTGSVSAGNIYAGTPPLTIGSAENIQRAFAEITHVALSNIARTTFPHGAFTDITDEPTLLAGVPIDPPDTQTADLAFLSLRAYPYTDGNLLVQGVIQNQGESDTINGFFTDLYIDHVPTGPGDLSSSIQFWVDEPIAAGASVTLTRVISDLGSLTVNPLTSGDEVTGTIYAQVDSTGVISETEDNNIYSVGVPVCLTSSDDFEDDDDYIGASSIAIGSVQTHNFHDPDDVDWLQFEAEAGVTYRIRTLDLASASDTYLYVYDSDGITVLASNDDFAGSLASQVDWQAPTTATYYVQIRHWNPNVGGCQTAYTIELAQVVQPASIVIDGLTGGSVGVTLTFTSTVSPITTTTSIVYVWQATGHPPVTYTAGISSTTHFSWTVTGPQTITVTATNPAGSVMDTLDVMIGVPMLVDQIQIALLQNNTAVGSRVYIVDDDDTPLEDVDVTVEWALPDLSAVTFTETTNQLGRIQSLAPDGGPGDYTITIQSVSKEGYVWLGQEPTSASVTRPGSGTSLISDRIQIALLSGGTSVGSRVWVVDEFDSPVVGAEVFYEWTLPDTSVVAGSATTTSRGYAQFLAPDGGTGLYVITVTDITKPGYTWTGGDVITKSIVRPNHPVPFVSAEDAWE